MPIYTDHPCDDGFFPMERHSLRSSIGIGPKVTKIIDAATKDWLDKHPEATTTVEDDSLEEHKLKSSFSLELCRCFDVVADMQAATDLKDGIICHTNGFHSAGDGGAAFYQVTADGEPNGMDVLAIQNDLIASLVITESYVTPEQFGAWGDGMHDDTDVWQKAVNIGLAVKAASNKYLCGKIDVTNNITIDCNRAEFICNADTLFRFSGELITTLANESDYIANQATYAITNAEYAEYSGFAMLKGTNNFETSRAYYYGGFACTFSKGKISSSYPVDATGVSIEIINPITAKLHNIGGITHTSPSASTNTIVVMYGLCCHFTNIEISKGSAYATIQLNSSLNCIVDSCVIKNSLSSVESNIIAIYNSSFCTISNCQLHNERWHCVTTGANYLCYGNVIDGCILTSDEQIAFQDHENGVWSQIVNSVCSGVGIDGLGVVRDSKIVSIKSTADKRCPIRINPVSVKNRAIYNIENVVFAPDAAASGLIGVAIASTPQVTGGTHYVTQLNIDNVKSIGIARCSISFWNLPSTSTYVIEDVNINNSFFFILLGNTSSTSFDLTNYWLNITNCNMKHNGEYMTIGANIYTYGNLCISDSHINVIAGQFKDMFISNVVATYTFGALGNSVSGKLYGSGIKFQIGNDLILGASDVSISDMLYGPKSTFFNITRDANNDTWYQRYINGVMTTLRMNQ